MQRPDAETILSTLIEALQQGEERIGGDLRLLPSDFEILVHRDAYTQLQPLSPYIIDEAKRQLDLALVQMNEPGLLHRVKQWVGKQGNTMPRAVRSGEVWRIQLNQTLDPNAEPDYLAVIARFAARNDLPIGGPPTRRLTIRKTDGSFQTAPVLSSGGIPARHSPPSSGTETRISRSAVAPPRPALATLSFVDDEGPKAVVMRDPELVIGRGDNGYDWVDVKLKTRTDVSREHLRIRYNAAKDVFEVKDVSKLGTTLNGVPLPPSMDWEANQDLERWMPVTDGATLVLAKTLTLGFKREGS